MSRSSDESDREQELEELSHRGDVTRSGTKGTKRVARTGDAVTALAKAISKLPAGSRRDACVSAMNTVSTM